MTKIATLAISYYGGAIYRYHKNNAADVPSTGTNSMPFIWKLFFVAALTLSILSMIFAKQFAGSLFNSGLILLLTIVLGLMVEKLSMYFKNSMHAFIIILLLILFGVNAYLEALSSHNQIIENNELAMNFTYIKQKLPVSEEFIPLSSSNNEFILYSPQKRTVTVMPRRLIQKVSPV